MKKPPLRSKPKKPTPAPAAPPLGPVGSCIEVRASIEDACTACGAPAQVGCIAHRLRSR